MICVVLHCDGDGCDCEQGYTLSTLSQHRDGKTFFDTAMRLSSQYGWLTVGNGKSPPDFDASVFCPDCAQEAVAG